MPRKLKVFGTLSSGSGSGGTGNGDMPASVYDPQGRQTDIFAYVDDKIGDIDEVLDAINGGGSSEGNTGTSTGADGLSAYEIALKNGFVGTETEWLESLKPEKGVDYFTTEDIAEIADEVAKQVTIDEVLPSQVVFPDGASTTYALGKVQLTNGSATLIEPGGTLADFFNIFLDEKNPATTDPAVTLTFSQAKAYEVGTEITPSYSASLSAGSYTYGPATGITAAAWEITDTEGNTNTTASGSFPQLQIIDGINYKITAKATYEAGTIPVTNLGNPYEAGQIQAGSKSKTSGAVTGYRNTFYGTTADKNVLTSITIRGLNKSGKALANGSSFSVSVPVGAMRVVIAYPATLRDLTSVKDVNGMSAEIVSGFSKQTLDVYGANSYKAISYKIYTLEFASANDTANTFTVTI